MRKAVPVHRWPSPIFAFEDLVLKQNDTHKDKQTSHPGKTHLFFSTRLQAETLSGFPKKIGSTLPLECWMDADTGSENKFSWLVGWPALFKKILVTLNSGLQSTFLTDRLLREMDPIWTVCRLRSSQSIGHFYAKSGKCKLDFFLTKIWP